MRINTPCGGIATILMVTLAINYLSIQINTMIKLSFTTFTLNDYHTDLQKIGSQSMQDYDDSFNMFIGTTNKQIDFLDNPYLQINVYGVDQNFKPKISEEVKLRKCEKEDLLKVVTETASGYYPNSMCFDDKSKIKLKQNWFFQEYENLYVSIDACNNSTYSGTCKDLGEIQKFLD